jgi:lipase chaperone LimK
MSLASARLTSLALTLARRSPASLRGRAVGAIARAVAADETPKLDDVIETLREIADDESAPDEDRKRAKKALIALGQVDDDDDEEKSKRAAKGQARAMSSAEQAVFDRMGQAMTDRVRRPEDKRAAAVERANSIARANNWPEVA